jgi:hypothetical protein
MASTAGEQIVPSATFDPIMTRDNGSRDPVISKQLIIPRPTPQDVIPTVSL